ncbi:MAG: hypothetical protein KGI71_05630 [Patescibacteria group bacterium]|nr:hypothetical protein [Patescibacteria group bacterium]
MAECYNIDSPAVALTAGTAKTVLIAAAASTQPFRVIEFQVSVDATTTGVLKVEFLVGTISGGTAGTAPNKSRMNGESWNKAPATTATGAYSAEPTWTKHASNDALAIKTFVLPLPSGAWDIEFPLGREFYVPESNSLGVRLTSTTVSPNSYTTLHIEE